MGQKTMEEALGYPESCRLCPRECGTDRTKQAGACRAKDRLRVARAALHMWEEPCITGEGGSGTVFFCGCSLGCIYCQNKAISRGKAGREISARKLADIFLMLQEKGAENINLVTAGHYVPPVCQALREAKGRGLEIPIVYNSSGYEKSETLGMLDGLVDIYLPDFKCMDEKIALRYCQASDYPQRAKEALAQMVRQTQETRLDERGMMRRGVLVRHLVLPGCIEDSKDVLRYLHDTYRDRIYISIMSQYTPVEIPEGYGELNRKVSEEEYEEVVDYAIGIGIENGFIQEGDAAQESFIPPFDLEGVL